MNISVVIPAYNEEKYIGRCLQALNNQSIQADEVIVVDNNCSDKTASIAKEYGARVIKEKMQGMTPARNTGYDAAKGDIIARTDADTVAPGNWISTIKKNFLSNSIDAVSGPIFYHDIPSSSTKPHMLLLDFMELLSDGKHWLTGPNTALTKCIWNSVKQDTCTDDKLVHEDLDLAIHIHRAHGVIMRDNTMVMGISARRIKKQPLSAFGEYPLRGIRTLTHHGIIPNQQLNRIKRLLPLEKIRKSIS